MKLSDDEEKLRLEISQSSEFQRVKNSSDTSCHGCILVEDVPFIMFRNIGMPNEVYLSYLTIPLLKGRAQEIGRFAKILAEMLND